MVEEMSEKSVKAMVPSVSVFMSNIMFCHTIEENFTESVELCLIGMMMIMMKFG